MTTATTTAAHRGWIAVGVDGSEGGRSAIRWAAREADRLGLELFLVHAYRGYHAVGGFYAVDHPLTPVADDLLPRNILAAAVREAGTLLPRDRIDGSTLRAEARAGLLQAAAESRMLVLGDERHPAPSRLVTGSVVAPVAAHAPVPVVVVPASWRDAPSHRHLVVAVRDRASSSMLVRDAFRLAAAHGARLTLVHAWELRPAYDDAVAGLSDGEKRARADLADLLDRIAPDFPGVRADVSLVRGQPARVLVDASAAADLLVIARRAHVFPYGHLGGTGRAVLRETRCPTMILPPSAEQVDLPAASGHGTGRGPA